MLNERFKQFVDALNDSDTIGCVIYPVDNDLKENQVYVSITNDDRIFKITIEERESKEKSKCHRDNLGNDFVGLSMEELKNEIKILEEKEYNCTITDAEKKRLKYLIWKYTNPIGNSKKE